MLEFVRAALPWVLCGLAVAIMCAAASRAGKDGRNVSRGALVAFLVLSVGSVSVGIINNAYADEVAKTSASDVVVSELTDSANSTGILLGRDVAWAGQEGHFDSVTLPNDLLAAGQDIRVYKSTLDGSVRAAGQTITVVDSTVKESMTLAGQNVIVKDSTSSAVAIASQSATFTGETGSLYIASADAIVNGVVHGDVKVDADYVIIGVNAVIEGTLTIESGQEPKIENGAKYGDIVVANTGSSETGKIVIAGMVVSAFAWSLITKVVFGFIGIIVIALLCEWLARKSTADAAAMLKTRTGAMLGSGAIAAIAAPVVLIVLCCLIVTLPVAFALALALVAITIIGEGFAAAALAKVAFPNMGRFKSMFLMAAIVGAISILPIIGSLVTIAGFMFMLGYVVQNVYLGMRSKPTQADSIPVQPGQPQ